MTLLPWGSIMSGERKIKFYNCFVYFRVTMETFTVTESMVKEFIPGQMVQNLKATLNMTRRKGLEHSHSPAEVNLRCVICKGRLL